MQVAKVAQKDEQGKDVMVWSAAPGMCPAHGEPVVLSAVYESTPLIWMLSYLVSCERSHARPSLLTSSTRSL